MDLIQSEQPAVPVEPEPRYVPQTASLPVERTEHGHTWFRLIAGILAALILIAIIVFAARWIYHKAHHKTVSTPATSQTESDISSRNATSKSQLQGSGSANSSAPANGSSPSTASNGTVTPNDGNANSQISNTGPGNVVAIFVGSSLVAGGLHYIISVRRFSKNRI